VVILVERGAFLVGFRRQGGAAQDRHEQVRVDAEQPLRCLASHRVGDGSADVAALGHVAGVAETAHQLRPRLCHAADVPAELSRLAGEAVPGDGRQHEVECVLGVSAVRGRVRERADRLEQLDNRTGPAVGHDQRQRVLVLRLDVDEVDLDAVDLGRELRERVELRLRLAPVVLVGPVACELLHRRQLDALRPVFDELLAGPARRGDAPMQVVQLLPWNLEAEGPDLRCVLDGCHVDLPAGFESTPRIVEGRRLRRRGTHHEGRLRRRGERSCADPLKIAATGQRG